ncbi:unnamed protein product [Caenorhabditis auriculariae]|uniref:FAM192A/Fyv6 N-terminal domain-containing protein n=1 Tax=Caenorhabditis auriculariae TaxID=2777116 RepID=A0A8S1GPD7_9PELO|nr:unnamed protein product [Caenorhabditis auriculariae]
MASGFVSTSEIEKERDERQQEWERVRKPDDPITAPEPEVCNKTLFEQLRDIKEAKSAELEEAKKFKNLIRGVDEDESDFLAHVNEIKHKTTAQIKKEEEAMLKELALAQSKIQTAQPTTSLKVKPAASTAPPKSKQASILSAAIKRKSSANDEVVAKSSKTEESPKAEPTIKVVAGIPGIIDYAASSDSESSNSSDEDCSPVPMLQLQPRTKPSCDGGGS